MPLTILRRWCRPGAPEPLDAFTPTNRSSCADFRHPTVQQNRHACLAFTGLRSGRRVILAVCIRRAPLKLNRASESDAAHRSTLRYLAVVAQVVASSVWVLQTSHLNHTATQTLLVVAPQDFHIVCAHSRQAQTPGSTAVRLCPLVLFQLVAIASFLS